jgi:hypothetical protein
VDNPLLVRGFFYDKGYVNNNVDVVTGLIGAEGARLLENGYRIFFVRGQIQGSKQCPAGVRGRGRPHWRLSRGGFPQLLRKAKHLELQSTDKFNTKKRSCCQLLHLPTDTLGTKYYSQNEHA